MSARDPPERGGAGDDGEIGEVKGGVGKELALKRSLVEPRHEPAPKEQERVDRKGDHHEHHKQRDASANLFEQIWGSADENPRALGAGAAGRTSVTCCFELTPDYRRGWFDVRITVSLRHGSFTVSVAQRLQASSGFS